MLWIALISLLVFTLDALVLWAFGAYKYAFVVTLIVGAAWAAWVWRLRKQTLKRQGLQGWVIGPGIELSNPDKPEKTKVAIEEEMLNKGFIVYGNTGSGKTKSLLIGYLHYLTHQHPNLGWLMADGKGNISLYQAMIGAGIEPDYLVSTVAEHSDTINLLGFEAVHEVEQMACALLLDSKVMGPSKFYMGQETRFLRQSVSVLFHVAKQENKSITMRDLKAFLTDAGIANEVLLKAAKYNQDPVAINELHQWNCSETRKKNLDGLDASIAAFTDGPISDRWCDPEPTLNLPKAVERGETIYLHMQNTELSKKMSIAIALMIKVITDRRQGQGSNAMHSLFPTIWEDWGGLMHDEWAGIISQSREVNMPASFSFQSVAQTDEVDMTHDLDDSLLTSFVFNVVGVKTRQFCSDKFGQYETAKVSVSDKTGSSFDGTNTQRVLVPRIAPDDFGALAKGQCYIATAANGEGGSVQRRYYKVRFPYLEAVKNPSSVDWPVIEKPMGEGLGLWEKIEAEAAELNTKRYTQSTMLAALQNGEANADPESETNAQTDNATEANPETQQASASTAGNTAEDPGTQTETDSQEEPQVESQLSPEDEAKVAAMFAEILPTDKKPKKVKSKKCSTKAETAN